MSLPKMTAAVDNISKLDTRPNAVNGLTADELKAKFDKAPEAIKEFLNNVLIPALDGAITLSALGAVPNTRKVNGKALNKDIELQAPDITYQGAVGGSEVHTVDTALDAVIAAISAGLKTTASDVQYQGIVGGVQVIDVSDALDELTLLAEGAVPKTRKVAGKALDADITIMAEDIPAFGPDQLKKTTQYLLDELAIGISNAVPKTRMVAGKTLDKDIALAAEDVRYSKTVGGVTIEGTVKTELNSLNAEMGGKVPTTRRVNGKPLTADVALTAVDVQYQGIVGGVQAGDVGEAIGILAAGVPLDMADDFAASGAASVQAWATMAKADDPALYRVPAGRYAVPDAAGEYSRIVTITDIPGTSARSVWVQECDPQFCYITRYTSAGPGDSPTEAFYLSNEERRLSLGGSNCLLPDYGSADNGKFLRIANGLPQWQTLTNVAEVGA